MPRFGVAIPNSPLPTGTVCVPLIIPDDDAYKQMLIDAIARLTHTRTYERDEAKTGKAIAQLWTEKTLSPLIQSLTTLENCGETTMSCEIFEDCAENSTIINNVFYRIKNIENVTIGSDIDVYNYTINNNTEIFEQLSELPANTQENPDLCRDALWAGCLLVAQELNNTNMDLLQQLTAVSGGNIRLLFQAIEAIPILGKAFDVFADEVIVADLLDFAGKLANELLIQYENIVTETLIRETACAYFAMGCSTCETPTINAMLNYHNTFVSGLNLSNTVTSLADIVSIFLTGNFTTDQYYHGMTWFVLWLTASENKVAGLRGTKTIKSLFRAGANSPDNDWSIWCDPCVNTWCYTMDFTAEDYDFTKVSGVDLNNNGVWVSGTGWNSTDYVNGSNVGNRMVWIEKVFAENTTIKRVDVTYDYTGGFFTNTSRTAFSVYLSDTVISVSRAGMTNGTSLVRSWTGSMTTSIMQLLVRPSHDTSAPYTYQGVGIIKSVYIEGEGYNPFGGSNC